MELTQAFIEAFIGNPSTAANGRKLVKSNSMQNCFISEDNTLIFGECKGSGKNPYRCSVDFINQAAPIARCSCPSRQIPCKHSSALLFHYIENNNYPTGPIPADIEEKRAKLEKRAENKERKKTETDLSKPPSKQKITAAKKRISVQLEGIETAERLVKNIIHTGLGAVDANMIHTLQNQLNELGNYYIGGIKEAAAELLIRIKSDTSDFRKSIEQLIFINALLKKARAHLETKQHDDSLAVALSIDSSIEQQIGYVWKLDELKAYGCFESSTELIQLAFYSYDNEARHEYVDESYMLSLQSGVIYKKINYRPYKAVKYVRADDTLHEIIVVEELYRYPGELNPRCRWNENTYRSVTHSDFDVIGKHARDNFAEVVKLVKGQLRSPLSDKNPLMLLSVSSVQNNCIIDCHGNKQTLSDIGIIGEKTTIQYHQISQELLKNTKLLVMYHADTERNELTVKPLTIIHDKGFTRLLY